MKNTTNRWNGIHYIVEGNGVPVVMVHGMGASADGWFYQIPKLVSAGYQVYALDLPGHGESHKPTESQAYHIATITSQFEAWFEDLRLPTPAILIGHSMGGYLCLSYALKNPEKVSRLVLANPLFSKKQLFPIMRLTVREPELSAKVFQTTPGWVLKSMINWFKNLTIDHPPAVLRQTYVDFRRSAPKILYTAPTIEDLTPRLVEVQTPTLVLWGKNDLTLSPNSFSSLIKRLPNSTGKGISNCGHTPHLTQPERFNQLMLEFLSTWT